LARARRSRILRGSGRFPAGLSRGPPQELLSLPACPARPRLTRLADRDALL